MNEAAEHVTLMVAIFWIALFSVFGITILVGVIAGRFGGNERMHLAPSYRTIV